ncbi:hypothetical protein J5U18_12620 [Sphingobacteriaceae bacterium WQ 2009]|uniref:N-acetylmuramoyl-L-alanine amidase n=1 Tax=Rhinopithecimicrobium faecis TaxID=2820698 RepID=A0A8T4HC70_9SPHI|nr:hypothetical protein [Sphingobacteriaceae bacterium WQ 2009]
MSAVKNGVQGYIQNSVHISYKGGMNGVYKELFKMQDVGKIKIRGHRDFSPDTNKNGKVYKWEWTKDCPSFDATAEYA